MRTQIKQKDFNSYKPKFDFTIQQIKKFIEKGKRNPTIIEFANILYRSGGYEAIFIYVRDYIRTIDDPGTLEVVQGPIVTMNRLAGDCEDKIILLNSLLGALFIVTRLRVFSQKEHGPFLHIATDVKTTNKSWVLLDPIHPDNEVGQMPDIFKYSRVI